MTIDKWEEIINLVESKFEVEDRGTLSDDFDHSMTEYIIFSSQFGQIKLEFISKPKVIDKKITYSNRIGSDTIVEYIYSPTEKIHHLLIYRWSEPDQKWLPLSAESLNLF